MAAKSTVIQLDEITADYNWNCRSRTRATSESTHESLDDGDKETPGVTGIRDSFEVSGQDTEVDVRQKDGKYHLVTGFRRFTAAKLLQKDKKSILGLKPGEIRARDHGNMDEVAARSLNLRENVNRENLVGPDLAYGVKKLQEANKDVTAKQIAATLGKSNAHIQNLLNIGKKVKASVQTKWRESPVRAVSIADMLSIAELPEDKQEAEYERLASSKADVVKGPGAWKATARKNAEKLGFMLGELEREKFLKKMPNAEFADYIRNILKFKVKGSDGRKVGVAVEKSIAAACEAGYHKGLLPPEEKKAEAEEVDDEV